MEDSSYSKGKLINDSVPIPDNSIPIDISVDVSGIENTIQNNIANCSIILNISRDDSSDSIGAGGSYPKKAEISDPIKAKTSDSIKVKTIDLIVAESSDPTIAKSNNLEEPKPYKANFFKCNSHVLIIIGSILIICWLVFIILGYDILLVFLVPAFFLSAGISGYYIEKVQYKVLLLVSLFALFFVK